MAWLGSRAFNFEAVSPRRAAAFRHLAARRIAGTENENPFFPSLYCVLRREPVPSAVADCLENHALNHPCAALRRPA